MNGRRLKQVGLYSHFHGGRKNPQVQLRRHRDHPDPAVDFNSHMNQQVTGSQLRIRTLITPVPLPTKPEARPEGPGLLYPASLPDSEDFIICLAPLVRLRGSRAGGLDGGEPS